MRKERSTAETQKKDVDFKYWSDVREELLSKEEQIKNEAFVKIIGKIVMRRKELNLTQEQLAKLVNITQANLARIERGDAMPRLDTFYKLIVALNLDLKLINKL